MTLDVLASVLVAAVVGAVLALAIYWSVPVLLRWYAILRLRAIRRSNDPADSRPAPPGSASGAEENRLVELKAELAAAEARIADRERQISVELDQLSTAQRERIEAAEELAQQEAALEERERVLEQSRADAARSAEAAAAEIEAREAALAAKEAALQERERERAGEPGSAERDSNWWEKQLGRPRSGEK